MIKFIIYKTDFKDTVHNVQYCSLKGHSDRKSDSFADKQLRKAQAIKESTDN